MRHKVSRSIGPAPPEPSGMPSGDVKVPRRSPWRRMVKCWGWWSQETNNLSRPEQLQIFDVFFSVID